MRSSLVAALVSCAKASFRRRVRRFLAGLSCDELQFIAEYLGSWILDYSNDCCHSRQELAFRIADFQRARGLRTRSGSDDLEHKTILLLEYLCRSGLGRFPVRVRTA